MKNRIIGIDVARALAVIGMIIVNFKIAFGSNGNQLLQTFTSLFEGKAAATFVVLAGVGIAFMTNKAVLTNDIQKLKKTKIKIIKRALFLFIGGLLYIPIWEADILHFYGIYMIITLLLITKQETTILMFSLIIILIYPLLILLFDYELGWNFDTLKYIDFWKVKGFFRNLLYNGFHPVFPWVSFMIIGLWFGKQDLNNTKFIKKILWVSLSVFVITQIISFVLIHFLVINNKLIASEISIVFGTSPMPPLPFYMLSGVSIALFVISSCILISKKFETNKLIIALSSTGQLALTFYVAHVLIGMGIIEQINPNKMGNYTIKFAVIYALVFSLFCVIFAVIWTKHIKTGPLEWIMRKITG